MQISWEHPHVVVASPIIYAQLYSREGLHRLHDVRPSVDPCCVKLDLFACASYTYIYSIPVQELHVRGDTRCSRLEESPNLPASVKLSCTSSLHVPRRIPRSFSQCLNGSYIVGRGASFSTSPPLLSWWSAHTDLQDGSSLVDTCVILSPHVPGICDFLAEQ